MSYLSAPLGRLECSELFSLSSLKLKLCDAGVKEAICFSKACVHAAKMSKKVYVFTEIFGKGHHMLLQYMMKQDGSDDPLLQKLISYTSNLKDGNQFVGSLAFSHRMIPVDIQKDLAKTYYSYDMLYVLGVGWRSSRMCSLGWKCNHQSKSNSKGTITKEQSFFLKKYNDCLIRIGSEATKALQNVSGGSRGKESETEWAARLAVHFFLPLSLVQDYILDSCSSHKVLECPCSCKSRINYGDTSIGHPKTWFGLFDIVIGKTLSPQERNKRRKPETEVHIAATVIPEEPDEESETLLESSEDNLSQIEVKFESLHKFFSQIASQSIVFSFYQKKCNSAVSIVPSIAVSKTHVQFHFYDCEKDLYFLSREMPLFSEDDNELLLETVIATWLVLNYRHLLSGPTEGMVKGEKFGFHSNVSDEVLNLYRNEIKMGITKIKTEHLDLKSGLYYQGVIVDASDTLKRKKNMKKQQS